jgi:hypothetical protein
MSLVGVMLFAVAWMAALVQLPFADLIACSAPGLC